MGELIQQADKIKSLLNKATKLLQLLIIKEIVIKFWTEFYMTQLKHGLQRFYK